MEIGRIDRELKRLWQDSAGAATRASLINFAVYCEGAEAMRKTTDIIFRHHTGSACRAILIGRDVQTPGVSAQASISAHCHPGRAGGKKVCCEQISFLLGRDGLPLIPNIVFSHLDSDLPLVLWWQGELPKEAEEQLWTWVDRLIFDSQNWTHAAAQFDLLRTSIEPAGQRIMLCDLNWTRSLYLRQAVAQIFDHPEYLAELRNLNAIEIVHAPGMRSTAVLLAGWLASQCEMEARGPLSRAHAKFRIGAMATRVALTLREEPGRALGERAAGVRVLAKAPFRISEHREGSNYLYADIQLPGDRETHCLMPGGNDDIVALLNDELMYGGKHKVYLKAVSAVVGDL